MEIPDNGYTVEDLRKATAIEIPEATEKIKKGEQVRLLFELLMEKLGGNFEESRGQFFERLKTCFEEHEEAINFFKNQIKPKMTQDEIDTTLREMGQNQIKKDGETLGQRPNKKRGVSPSNY